MKKLPLHLLRNNIITKIMKLRFVLLSALLLSVSLFAGNIYAQSKYSLAVYYKHLTENNEHYKRYYPLGFGSIVSRNISDKLALTAGLEYSRYHNEYINKLAPVEYRSEETFNESHYSLIAGLAFYFLEKKLNIRGGVDIVSTYFRTRGEVSRYYNSTGELDLYIKNTDSDWDLGIKLKADLQYNLSKNLGILVQPGYTRYLFGEARKSDFFSASAGLAYIF